VSNEKPHFPHEKRDLGVYFDYAYMLQDAVRVHLPASIRAESIPTVSKEQYEKYAAYSLTNEQKSDAITVRRDFILGDFYFEKTNYPALRSFYGKIENKDQENLVLTTGSQASTTPNSPAASN